MGFTLNGNTSLIVVGVLAISVVGSITAIIIAGQSVPDVLSIVLISLVSAVAGGAAVNRVNQSETKTIATNAAQTVIDQSSTPPTTP